MPENQRTCDECAWFDSDGWCDEHEKLVGDYESCKDWRCANNQNGQKQKSDTEIHILHCRDDDCCGVFTKTEKLYGDKRW